MMDKAQGAVDKTKNLGVEMNTEIKQTAKITIRKGEGGKRVTGKTIKKWEEGKIEEKKDGTGRRPQSKRSGESTPKEDGMEVEIIKNENSNTKEAEHKTPVKDRTDQGKTAREEEVEIEEGIITLPKTSVQTKSPQEKSASKASAKKSSFASVCGKEGA